MTREEWQRAEPVLSQALLLPEPERQKLIDTAFLEDALRRELLDVLRKSAGTSRVMAGAGHASVVLPPPLRAPALKPGDALDAGRYVVIRQIGRGGMGSVYLAHDTMLGTLIALKALPDDDRLIAEARRAAVCSDHPHVATIHNILRTEIHGERIGLLVMEYVAGTPVSRLLDDGPVEIMRALRWGRQVAGAIAHAHDHQVLHCDLKPANIVITADGRAKVLDFGIARATFDPVNPSEPLRGTMPYMAPEQLLAGEFTQAGDIYSLGVTLFELITGRRPFEGDDTSLRMRIVAAPPPPLMELVAGAPPQLADVLERAMAKEPEQRFRSARSFERALEGVETGVYQATTATVMPRPATSPSMSAWSKVGVAAVVLAAVLAGMTALGALTSSVFNMTLERGAFAQENVGDWLVWGRRTSFAPFFWLIVLVILVVPLMVTRRLLQTASARYRALDEALADRLHTWRAELRLDTISVAASVALLGSGAMLSLATWYYWPLLEAVSDFASRAPASTLALLSERNLPARNAYRRDLTTVIVVGAVLWYPVFRQALQGQRLHWGMWLAGGAMLIAALVLLHAPYRLMNYRSSFEVVRWSEVECYVTGERQEEVLLFCPMFEPPRTRVVATSDARLQRTGRTVTNLFDRFVPGGTSPAPVEQAN